MTVCHSVKVFLKTRESGGNAAPGWLKQSDRALRNATAPPLPPPSVCCVATDITPRKSGSAEKGGGRRSLREQVQVKRLSQWRCVHSFMSFESPEEVSAKPTEPNVQERGSIPVC